MALTPVNVVRVSQNLRAFNLLSSLSRTQVALFRSQNQLASGLRFQTPSEDPTRAGDAIRLDARMDVMRQVATNLRTANATLAAGESAMQDAVDLTRQARDLASQSTGDSTTPDERRAMITVVDSILEQLVSIGNRTHLGSHLFSGRRVSQAPFEFAAGGVRFHGDNGRRETLVDSDFSRDAFTISGMEFFGAASTRVVGNVDLDPWLTPETRLSDLGGATNAGIDTGRIQISDGTTTVQIDLGTASTIGDVVNLLNDRMPATLSASLSATGIQITPASGSPSITVIDIAGGASAVKLGIASPTPQTTIVGQDLRARVTPRTAIADLRGGLGLDLSDPIVIRAGGSSAVIDFDGATTVEDVINRINGSGIGVVAEIAADGARINVTSRLSGVDVSIEESGGQTATNLGIRSTTSSTPLSQLNEGRGVTTVAGDDLRIVTADGTTIDIDLDALTLSSATIGDVLALMNTAGGGAITASLGTTGNGIVITDNTAGGGSLRVERLNLSPAIDWLGLDQPPSGGQMVGRDVNPVRVDGVFTALIELRAALDKDDSQAIADAGQRLERSLSSMQRVQGKLAATAQTMQRRAERIDDESTATQILLSDVRDVDMTEAVVRFQQMQTALEANMRSASQVLSLSLLDYLR